MTLSAGAKLGPYEIVAPLGAGGMGEVWKATDARLDRAVALKVLPEDFFEDKERVARFEREAKLLAALNHPNIAAIYSFEEIPGVPGSSGRHVLVQELLEGETLRSALAGGKLSPRKAIDYALADRARPGSRAREGDRASGPEAREPVRDEGRPRQDPRFRPGQGDAHRGGPEVTSLPTASAGTEPGVVMGTLGYMSPEQVKGKPADARSDIFSFGAILYEMLSGRRAFHGDSAAETMSAILREEPPDLSVTNQSISPGLERIVRHCLEKNPEQRFHSAHDVAFALETAMGASSAPQVAAAPAETAPARPSPGASPAAPPRRPSAPASCSAYGFARRRRRIFAGSPITAVTSSPPGSLRTDRPCSTARRAGTSPCASNRRDSTRSSRGRSTCRRAPRWSGSRAPARWLCCSDAPTAVTGSARERSLAWRSEAACRERFSST